MSKLCVESTLGLSVNKLLRWGYIDSKKYVSGSIYWGDEDNRAGSISFVCRLANSLELNYSANGEPIRQAIDILWTACHYGNKRPWFECPICHRRVGRLFYRARRFACRRCQKLCYTSQLENPRKRGLGLSFKLLGKLEAIGGSEDFKPPRMHWKTYNRILERANASWNKSFVSYFNSKWHFF